jgi:leucyl-tRNA synthetase
MDTFFDSSWYMMRYLNPHYDEGPFQQELLKKWMPVDQYTGGAEHAVMHLLYARFFIKALRDLGLVDFDEPFLRLCNQGIILGEDHEKMSKSRGNVVSPDDVVGQLGADAVRCFLMFLGPWEQGSQWSSSGVNGVSRWLNRVWDLAERNPAQLDNQPTDPQTVRQVLRQLHQTICKCHDDLDRFKFNTAVAALMEFSNQLNRAWNEGGIDSATWRECIKNFLLLLAPMAPHITEELWERTGHQYSIHQQPFPQWDDDLAAEEMITLVLQVNGKVRDRALVPAGIDQMSAQEVALASPKVQAFTQGKTITRAIYVPGKLVNVVVR